jgi:hypothetical protein
MKKYKLDFDLITNIVLECETENKEDALKKLNKFVKWINKDNTFHFIAINKKVSEIDNEKCKL